MAFMQQSPFYNLRIPFSGIIQGGLHEGKSITVNGQVHHGADRFQVDLECGADIAFHFNPRYQGSPHVVANTRLYGNWGPEEIKHNSPIAAGCPFTLTITVTRDCYQVIVNGSHFMDYRHRIPFQQVHSIGVGGKVEISSISFPTPAIPAQPAFPGFAPQRIPFSGIIPGGLQEGKSITVNGQVHPGADRFQVDLECGADIAFHFNPRYQGSPYVVANTRQYGNWGPEERKQNSPIAAGCPFTLTITVTRDCYQVIVNSSHFMEYRHRIPFQQVDSICVGGKVDISSISFQTPAGLKHKITEQDT